VIRHPELHEDTDALSRFPIGDMEEEDDLLPLYMIGWEEKPQMTRDCRKKIPM
jgi:hypothetical protein